MWTHPLHHNTPHTSHPHPLDCKSIWVTCILHLFLSDPPQADAVLYTDKSTHTKIEQLLTDEKYTTPLKLIVEECDKEKLKAQEEARKDRAFPDQKKTFTQTERERKKVFFNKTDLYTCGGIQKDYMFNYWWIFNFSKIIAMMHWIH